MEIFCYKGYWGCDSKCGLDIEKDKDSVKVTFTELDDNSGTSVTNAIEFLATKVYWRQLVSHPVQSITWIEHYPSDEEQKETFDEVTFDWDGKQFTHPKWKRLSNEGRM